MDKVYYLTWVDEDNLTHTEMLVPNNKRIVIGRSPTSDIVLVNPSVSRIHAELSWQNNLLGITDLNSSYGTWLNDKRLNVDENNTLYVKEEIEQVIRMSKGRPILLFNYLHDTKIKVKF